MKKVSENTRPLKRHLILMQVLKYLVGWIFVILFNFKYKRYKLPETPAIVLANHNSDYDPIFAGMVFSNHLYFVTSEHLIGQSWLGKLVGYIFGPIVRVKGTTESRAAKEILTTLRKGLNVCLFAEGNRSFTGETGPISISTGKLVKRSGAALVTYKLKGGYFSTPRWAKGIRRGLVKGEVVNFYSKAQVAEMSDKEIYDIIVKDLYVNAYDDQKEKKVRYKSNKKNYAVGIEIALYTCPQCEKIGTIKSEDNKFFCECGLDMQYSEDGLIIDTSHNDSRFNSIVDWDRWQVEKLKEKLLESDDNEEEIFHDTNQTLYIFEAQGRRTMLISGDLSFYRDRLEFHDDERAIIFYFNALDDIEITGRMTITFVTKDRVLHEVRSSVLRSPTKYRDSFRILKNRNT